MPTVAAEGFAFAVRVAEPLGSHIVLTGESAGQRVRVIVPPEHPDRLLLSQGGPVYDCAFSADSAYLVTVCSDHYARLWELGTASIIRQYNGHHRGAVCVALNDYSNPP